MKIISPAYRPIFRLLPKACAAAALLGLFALPSANAASGTWSSATTGLWSNSGNWAASTIADGSGNTAFFNALDLTANVAVHLDTARTIGSLNFTDTGSTAGVFNTYTIDNNGSSSNVLTLAGGTPTITVATSNTATISAEISGTSGFVKAGSGNLILSGVNTYSGTTSVTNSSGGFVQFNADSAFGSSTLLVSSQNGGLKFGATVNDLRAITFGSGGGRIDTNGFDSTYSSVLSGSIGAGNAFTKIGAGTLTLAGSNNIIGGGGVNISGGFLQIDSNARLGSGTGGLTINASGGGIKFGGAFNDLRAITLGTSGGTLDTNGFNIAVSSTISSTGAGALIKAGSGTLTLSANNTYTGQTKVNVGTLLVNGDQSAATGAVTVASGATLGGTGIIGGVTTGTSGSKLGVLDGAGNTLTFSNASATALDISSAVSSTNTGELVFELGSTANSDKIVLSSLTSGLSIGTAVLNFNDFSFTALSGFGAGTYTLFDTNTAIIGTLGSSLTGTINGLSSTISFGDGGHDIVVTVVPEPSTVAMLTLGGVGCIVWRIRRRVARA